MISLRQQSINVNRLLLIGAIETGLAVHKLQYAEAVADYEKSVTLFLEEALGRAVFGDFSNVHLKLKAPVSKEGEYQDALHMLSASVDEVINLDKDAYKAYYRNEWPWTNDFLESIQGYKDFAGSLGRPG